MTLRGMLQYAQFHLQLGAAFHRANRLITQARVSVTKACYAQHGRRKARDRDGRGHASPTRSGSAGVWQDNTQVFTLQSIQARITTRTRNGSARGAVEVVANTRRR